MTDDALDRIPRVPLWDQITPLEPLERLADAVGAAAIWAKRDDCNGLGFGGNKVRQLEYYLGDAQAQGADTVLLTGAVQSNFVRTAAAAAARIGMGCHIQLEDRVPKQDADYLQSGNVLLDQVFGAVLHRFPEGENEPAADANLRRIAGELRAAGRVPYVVPMDPSHVPLGALGYIRAAEELAEQIANLEVDRVFVASGSGNTHAGLLYGLRRQGVAVPVQGICVRRGAALQGPRIAGHTERLAALLEEDNPVGPDDIQLDDRFLPPRYGIPGEAAAEALVLTARREGMVLDPVYTSKVMAGLIAQAGETPGEAYVFIHTGGGPSIFGYADDLREMAASD